MSYKIQVLFTPSYEYITTPVCSISKQTKWDEEEFEHMATKIRTFKYNFVSSFGIYQTSGMRTVKWHGLDQSVWYIRGKGSISLGSADLYEYASREPKKTSNRTSVFDWRGRSAYQHIEECVERILGKGQTNISMNQKCINKFSAPRRNSCISDNSQSLKPFMKMSVGVLMHIRSVARSNAARNDQYAYK